MIRVTHRPSRPSSPLRVRLDRLLEILTSGAIDSQGPLVAGWIRVTMERQGWDSRALSRRGPLREVSDAALLRLLIELAEEIDEILVAHGGEVEPATREDAIADLVAAIR